MNHTNFACVLLLLFAPGVLQAQQNCLKGKPCDRFCLVDSVTDGDTLRCDGSPIRLLLIDTPEMDQDPWGEMAKEALESLAPPGTRLHIEHDLELRDRYNRELAYLYLDDGRSVNEELLRMGVALLNIYPPNIKYVDRFRAIQEEAVLGKIGLWAFDAFSCTPADHRAGKCNL